MSLWGYWCTTTTRRLWLWRNRFLWIPSFSVHSAHKPATTRTLGFASIYQEKGCLKARAASPSVACLGHFSTHQSKKRADQLLSWMRMTLDFTQSSPICKAAMLTAGYQLLFFLPTAVFRMDKLTDFAGASNFAVLALWSYLGYSSFSTRQRWITSLVVLWSARLALFLGYRILFVLGEDRRLDSFRDNLFKLIGFWTFQGLWAFVVSLPAVLCNMNIQVKSLGRLDYCGCTLFAIGFLLEMVADFQKQYFKQRNPDRWCDWGLWKYSRHPNYFGELLVWYGIYVFAWNGLTTFHRVIALSSPLLITWLLIRVSGIPLLEKSADTKYGSLLEYQLYKKRTSILIPLPPKMVERWNRWVDN